MNRIPLLITGFALLIGTTLAGNALADSLNGAQHAALISSYQHARVEVVAWIPRTQASIQSVAMAKAQVALASAKREAEADLCGGRWQLGNPGAAHSAVADLAPALLGGKASWQYVIPWQPELHKCPDVAAQEFLQAVSDGLPEWMLIRDPAGQRYYYRGSVRDDNAYVRVSATH